MIHLSPRGYHESTSFPGQSLPSAKNPVVHGLPRVQGRSMWPGHKAGSQSLLPLHRNARIGGAWLAQLVEHTVLDLDLDLDVVSSSFMMGVEPTKKNKLNK